MENNIKFQIASILRLAKSRPSMLKIMPINVAKGFFFLLTTFIKIIKMYKNL